MQDRAACRPGTAPARDRQHIPRPIPPSRAARRRCAAVGPRHELSGGRRGVRVARETRSPSRGRGGGRGGVKPAKRARAEGAHSLHANPHSKRCGGRRAVCELRLSGAGTRGSGQPVGPGPANCPDSVSLHWRRFTAPRFALAAAISASRTPAPSSGSVWAASERGVGRRPAGRGPPCAPSSAPAVRPFTPAWGDGKLTERGFTARRCAAAAAEAARLSNKQMC